MTQIAQFRRTMAHLEPYAINSMLNYKVVQQTGAICFVVHGTEREGILENLHIAMMDCTALNTTTHKLRATNVVVPRVLSPATTDRVRRDSVQKHSNQGHRRTHIAVDDARERFADVTALQRDDTPYDIYSRRRMSQIFSFCSDSSPARSSKERASMTWGPMTVAYMP